MRGLASRGIITNNSQKNGLSKDWWQYGIFFIALVLRIFRFDTLTEFLGDQGRTLRILEQWFTHGILPLAGPTTLTGEHLGPFFYYLLAPGYLVAGVIGATAWVAILGALSVFVLYAVLCLVSTRWAARVVSLLWAVSPLLIRADRVIWEPNLVPLFVLLFVYSYIYALRTGNPWWWVKTGIVSGILIQLHYPTLLFVALVGLEMLYGVVRNIRQWKMFVIRGAVFVFGVFLPLIPFVVYELQHRFADIFGILSIFARGGGDAVGKRTMVLLFTDYLARVFGRTVPFMNKSLALGLFAASLVYFLVQYRRFAVFLMLWLTIGLAAMARYPGVVYDHYLFFLLPVPFLMAGLVLRAINNPRIRAIVTIAVLLLAAVQLSYTDAFVSKNSDIWRVSAVVGAINDESRTTPFSFTLIQSPSFSDLHYRYFMDTMHLVPQSITSTGYRRLYIICDSSSCPSVSELTSRQSIPVICFDEHCEDRYPNVMLNDWSYERQTVIAGRNGAEATVYRFVRR